MPGTNAVIEWPRDFASLYPVPSDPVFGAVFPPQAKITLLAVNNLYVSLVVDYLKFLSLWISFILQPVYKGIFLNSSDIFKISTTEDACNDCG